jgi:predicted metal-dependent hydrolase
MIMQGGRPKAFRPLPWPARRDALHEAISACARGEWFLAHEILEPAWMGTADMAERDFYQGLIKVAAAHVHRDRGNATGMTRHLEGAKAQLAAAGAGRADDDGLDLPALIEAIDDRLARLATLGQRPVNDVPPIDLPRRH